MQLLYEVSSGLSKLHGHLLVLVNVQVNMKQRMESIFVAAFCWHRFWSFSGWQTKN